MADDEPQPGRVADQRGQELVRGLKDQRQPLGRRRRAGAPDGLVQQGVEPERGWVQLQIAGVYLRQVDQIVDDAQQALAGLADALRVTGLHLVRRALSQQGGEAEHAVQWRAQLVADVGEEALLGLGRTGAVLGGAQRAHRLDLGGDLALNRWA